MAYEDYNENVFVPTDKANNNVSIICKKFYVQLIKNEVNSQTYNISSESVESIIDRHEVFLEEHGIKLISENKRLPYLYGITKMYKDPIKFRYITSGAPSSLKQLSATVGLILQRYLKIAKNHSAYHNRYYPRNDYYVIDSNSDVLQFMFNSNLDSGYKSLTTFDFSTLYTSIPHPQLKDNLNNFLNRIFDIKSKCFVVCNLFSKCVYFSDSDSISKSCVTFTIESLLECLDYLIDNAFIIFDGNVYRQANGIPMGTNAGPHVANIYLHQYENVFFYYLYINNMMNELSKLQHVFRFQDDLISFNDHGYLESCINNNIYPSEMIVNKTNISVQKTNFLDMTISIYRHKFYIKLYDKRNDYDFDVISFPYLDGNIPKSQSYGIFISQLIRYVRINTSSSNFISDCRKLVTKLVGQYFDVAALRKRFQVFINKHFNVWGKYGVPLSVNHVFVNTT